MNITKKITKSILWAIVLSLVIFVGAGVTVTKAQEDELHIDVSKTIESVSCVTQGNVTTSEVKGTYVIKNESPGGIRLDQIRDWVSEFPFADQPIAGAYSLAINGGSALVYNVSSSMVDDSTPSFQTLNFGPINQDETVTINYDLIVKEKLPKELYNSVDFKISNVDNPAEVGNESFGDHQMFEGPAVCQVVTPTPTSPPAGGTAATPTPKVSPTVLGVSTQAEQLPVTGADINYAWIYYLLAGLAVAGLYYRFTKQK